MRNLQLLFLLTLSFAASALGQDYSPVNIMFSDQTESPSTLSKPFVHLFNNNASGSGDVLDIGGYVGRYYFQEDHNNYGDSKPGIVPTFFFRSDDTRIWLESCGADNYAVAFQFRDNAKLFPHGSSEQMLFGIWNGDPEWPKVWHWENDFSGMAPSTSYSVNPKIALFDRSSSMVVGSAASYASLCVPGSATATSSSSSVVASGDAKVQFFMRDEKPSSNIQATVRIKMTNPGTQNYLIQKGSYYRYYFHQPMQDFVLGNKTISGVLPTFVKYWDSPNTDVSMEGCGTDYYSIKYTFTAPRLLYAGGMNPVPGLAGNVIDIYMDYFSWPPLLDKTDDYSWLNTSTFLPDSNIAMFNPDGNLIFGIPPTADKGGACSGDKPALSSSSSTPPVSTCPVYIMTSSSGGTILPSGTVTISAPPTSINIDAMPSAGYYFSGWTSHNSQDRFTDTWKASTTVIPVCNDTLWANFSALPVSNGSFEDGCGDEPLLYQCSEAQHEVTDMAGPDFKHVWISNDSSHVHFLIQLCGVVDFSTSQYLYADYQQGGDANGYDARLKIEFYHPDSTLKMLMSKETYDATNKRWVFTQESGPGGVNPAFGINLGANQSVPGGGTANAGTLIEASLPVLLDGGSVVRWWIDGSLDHVKSATSPDYYYVNFPPRQITTDGLTADWLVVNSSSAIASSSSATSSVALSSSSVAVQSSSTPPSPSSSSTASCANAGDCASNPLLIVKGGVYTISGTTYLKIDPTTLPASTEWSYTQPLELQVTDASNAGKTFSYQYYYNGALLASTGNVNYSGLKLSSITPQSSNGVIIIEVQSLLTANYPSSFTWGFYQ